MINGASTGIAALWEDDIYDGNKVVQSLADEITKVQTKMTLLYPAAQIHIALILDRYANLG